MNKYRFSTQVLVNFLFVIFVAIVLCSCGSGGGEGSSSNSTSDSNLSAKQIAEIEGASEIITNKIQGASIDNISENLEEAKATALTQPSVESAEIIDGQLAVKYKDAGYEVWVSNTSTFDTPVDLSKVNIISKNYVLNKSDSSLKLTKGPTGTTKAVLINALDEDDYLKAGTRQFVNDVTLLLESQGYDVTTYAGEEASPENMKNLSEYSVIIMLGHGGFVSNSQYYPYNVQTGKEWPKDYNISFIDNWKSNAYVKVDVPWGVDRKYKSFCGLTGKFWKDTYQNSHFNNALFMNLACSGAKFEAYRNDLFSVGVSAYTGWTKKIDVTISLRHASEMLKAMVSPVVIN